MEAANYRDSNHDSSILEANIAFNEELASSGLNSAFSIADTQESSLNFSNILAAVNKEYQEDIDGIYFQNKSKISFDVFHEEVFLQQGKQCEQGSVSIDSFGGIPKKIEEDGSIIWILEMVEKNVQLESVNKQDNLAKIKKKRKLKKNKISKNIPFSKKGSFNKKA